MNETYPSTPGADFYGVGGLVEGVEVIPEHCVGSFTFPGYHQVFGNKNDYKHKKYKRQRSYTVLIYYFERKIHF